MKQQKTDRQEQTVKDNRSDQVFHQIYRQRDFHKAFQAVEDETHNGFHQAGGDGKTHCDPLMQTQPAVNDFFVFLMMKQASAVFACFISSNRQQTNPSFLYETKAALRHFL